MPMKIGRVIVLHPARTGCRILWVPHSWACLQVSHILCVQNWMLKSTMNPGLWAGVFSGRFHLHFSNNEWCQASFHVPVVFMATLEKTGNICLFGILVNHLFIITTYYLVHFLVLGMLFEYLYCNLYQKDLFNSMILRILKSRPLNLSLYFLWSDCHNKMSHVSVFTKFTVSCCSPGWMWKLPRNVLCLIWPSTILPFKKSQLIRGRNWEAHPTLVVMLGSHFQRSVSR